MPEFDDRRVYSTKVIRLSSDPLFIVPLLKLFVSPASETAFCIGHQSVCVKEKQNTPPVYLTIRRTENVKNPHFIGFLRAI